MTPHTQAVKHAKLALNHGELIAVSQQTPALHLTDYMVISGYCKCLVMLGISRSCYQSRPPKISHVPLSLGTLKVG